MVNSISSCQRRNIETLFRNIIITWVYKYYVSCSPPNKQSTQCFRKNIFSLLVIFLFTQCFTFTISNFLTLFTQPYISVPNPEVYSEPCLISEMTHFAEIGSNLAIFAKHSVLKFRQATEYASSTLRRITRWNLILLCTFILFVSAWFFILECVFFLFFLFFSFFI